MPPLRRQRLEGVVHTFGKNSVKSKNGHRWSTVLPNRRQFRTAQHNTIYSRPGPSLAAVTAQTSLECFQLIITDNFVDHIVRSTNDIITSLAQNYVRCNSRSCDLKGNESSYWSFDLLWIKLEQPQINQAYTECKIWPSRLQSCNELISFQLLSEINSL